MRADIKLTDIKFHEILQEYFQKCYNTLKPAVEKSMFAKENQIYGELYYYSVVKLLQNLTLTPNDHFLDVGSGLGKIVFQLFISTDVASVTGIEINRDRHFIAENARVRMAADFPAIFNKNRELYLINADFLQTSFDTITIVYVCSTVFSFALLTAIGNKINSMQSVRTVVTFRKLPNLTNFSLFEKIFLHGTWDYTPCYIYTARR